MTVRRATLLVVLGLLASFVVFVPRPQVASGADPTLVPLSDRRVATGWIPWWRLSEGISSVVANPDLFEEASPFWYRATAASTVVAQDASQPAESALVDAVQSLHAVGVRVLPTVNDAGMTSTSMANVLSDPTRRAELIDSLVAMVQRVGADGVDIDFEAMNFPASSDRTTVRKKFPVFLSGLQQSLHDQGLLLSLSVPSRVSDNDPNWAIFDYGAIAPFVDRVKILTYDYSYAGGDPGPVAPLNWVDQVTRYAKSRFRGVPLSIGQPAYGYNWYIKTLSGTCPASIDVKATTAPTTQQALALADTYNATIEWDKASGEYHYTYHRPYPDGGSDCVVLREVWFEAARSVKAKLSIVAERHVQGLAFWTLGNEDPASWNVLDTYATGISPAPANATMQAPTALGYGAELALTGHFRVAGQPVIAQPVDVQRRVPGGTWSTVGSVVTSSLGIASYATPATRTYDWRMRLTPAWDWSAGFTTSQRVLVRHVVSAAFETPTVVSGAPFQITGTIGPAESGATVIRQRFKGGVWVDGPQTVTTAGGGFSLAGTAGGPGAYTYRVLAVADGKHGGGVSASIVLTVT